ncbi:MAG: pilin [Undibacterium sp.]
MIHVSSLQAACPAGYDDLKGTCIPNTTGLSTQDAKVIVKNVMNWLLAVLGFIAVIGFVISGIQYLMAAGDEKTIETAKTNMKYSIIGVIVALSGYIVITAIDSLLNATTQF